MKETITRTRCDICHIMILDLNGHIINIRGQIFDVCASCAPKFNLVVQFLIVNANIPIDYMHVS